MAKPKKRKNKYNLRQTHTKIELQDYEYSSEEIILIAFTMFEAQGYYGLLELMSIVEDPDKIMQILYLLNGMTLKIPTAKEMSDCLKAAGYVYCDTSKRAQHPKSLRSVDIREALNISDQKEDELLKIYANWVKFMTAQGYDPNKYIAIKANSKHVPNSKLKMARLGQVYKKQ